MQSIGQYFTTGHDRSIQIKKNLVLLFVFKILNMMVSFFMVPLTLHYLASERYGLWVTLTSMIGWFSLLDVGLGNGMRNRFVEAKEHEDDTLVKMYVSTTYFSVSVIAAVFLALFTGISELIPWNSVLNTSLLPASELRVIALIICFFFCIRLVVDLISTILLADQRPAVSAGIAFASNALSFLFLYLLSTLSHEDLLLASIVLSSIPVAVLIGGNVILFSRRYRKFAPSIQNISLDKARSLASLGVKFFIIQLSGIILFSTSNIIITQLFGPGSVTPYNIAMRYLGMVSMTFTIVLTPFWSAYTEAYLKNDIPWIQHTTRKLLLLFAGFASMIIVMVVASPWVYDIWIGKQANVSSILTIIVAAFTIITMWNSIFANFINGVGKITLQFYNAIIVGIINIPLSIFLSTKVLPGPEGVILSTCFCLLLGSFWAPIQYWKIISGKAKGLWDR